MATINLYTYGTSEGDHKIRYALGKQLPGDPVSSEGCAREAEAVITQFAAVRDGYGAKCDKPMAEMIHSFSPEESKKMSPELVNKIGHEVATTMFPGHQMLIVTHLDRGHYHNHILMNRYHSETGKLSRDNFPTLKKLRSLNDSVCKAQGLSIPNQSKQEREARMPKNVAQMIKYGKSSYIADMMQKADYARSIATGYGQYQSILSEFGVNVRVEKKNISYFYPGVKDAKRGRNMGSLYDKPGLEAAFQDNDERFQKNPKLRQLLISGLNHAKSDPASIGKISDHLASSTDGHFKNGVKDYAKHEIIPRREARWARASEEELTEIRVPIDEMRKARRTNIVGYCQTNGIRLEPGKDGWHVMKERPHVELNEYEWRNKKNNTRGTLIDLVAAHKKMTFLESIAEINGNKRLLLLQKEVGQLRRTSTSYYVPRPERNVSQVALGQLVSLLDHHGVKNASAEKLLKTDQVQVSKSGIVRIFGLGDENGAMEYVKENNGQWRKEKKGHINEPFFSHSGSGRKAVIFMDPFAFLERHGKDGVSPKKVSGPVLALMEPSEALIDRFLSSQKHVDTLQIVASDPAKRTKVELDFFNNLKNRYHAHGVSVEFISMEQTLPGRGLSLER